MDPNYYYTVNGFIVHSLSEVPENAVLQKHPRLCGGKGGFGSMLRAIGSQIEKTTNREMCRDLNGRRMRDINNEKKLKEWLDKSDTREREKIEAYLEKRRKRKVLLEQGPSTNIPYEDKTKDDQRKQIAEELQEAIAEAFENRKHHENITKDYCKPKKYNLNIDSDLESSSSSCPSSPTCDRESDNKDDNPTSIESSVNSEEPDVKETSEILPESVEEPDVKETSEMSPESFDEPPTKLQKFDDKNLISENHPPQNISKEVGYPPIDLNQVGSVNHMLTFGADWIKNELQTRGLKCGGTLMERAQRLFSVKGLEKYPDNLLVGVSNRKRK